MKEFEKTYLDLIYEWNEQEIKEQALAIAIKTKPMELYDMTSKACDLVWESTYFDEVDDVFEDWFSDLFDEYIKEMQNAIVNNSEFPFHKEIKISDIAQHLPKNKIKNYKSFHNFIDILKNSSGTLKITISGEPSYYSPPIKWTGEKIKIKDRTHIFINEPIDKAGELYRSYMEQLTKKCETLYKVYHQIKEEILTVSDFGTINIYNEYFKNERSEFKKSAFTHEFGHFLDYLIKINAENWDIGRKYRSHEIHSEFVPNNMNDEQNRMNYFNDETEFKRFASTYISDLKKIFQKNTNNSKDEDEIKLFFEAVMSSFDIPNIHYCRINMKNQKMFSKYSGKIMMYFHFEDMKDFFNVIYQDSLKEAENKGSRNRWTILKKWLWNEFTKH